MTKRALVAQELRGLYEKHGVLRPEDVVRHAKNPRTALHSQFEWDDGKAAHEYRLWQARVLIRVTVEVLPQTGEDARVFVSLMDDRMQKHGGYRTLVDVLSNRTQREKLLEEALVELNAMKLKYGILKELAGVFTELDKVSGKRKRKAA